MNLLKIERKKLVKIISIEILVCVITSALIGIGLLFKLFEGSDVLGRIMLSLLTLFIAGLFLLNSINAISSGNKIGVFSACMIVFSAVLFLLLIWLVDVLGSFYTPFIYIVVIVSMISILLNLIIGNYIALGTSLLAIQSIFYVCFAYVQLVLSFVILGNSALINVWQVFVLACILVLTFYVVLKVKQKNIAQNEVENIVKGRKEGFITITKEEYEGLKAEIARLKTLVGETESGSVTEDNPSDI
ncbi:MAG: hypothetical protein IJU83_02545 [Clostridia bacterium]|nr:hypothetical protein [Clostridia bacterium]